MEVHKTIVEFRGRVMQHMLERYRALPEITAQRGTADYQPSDTEDVKLLCSGSLFAMTPAHIELKVWAALFENLLDHARRWGTFFAELKRCYAEGSEFFTSWTTVANKPKTFLSKAASPPAGDNILFPETATISPSGGMIHFVPALAGAALGQQEPNIREGLYGGAGADARTLLAHMLVVRSAYISAKSPRPCSRSTPRSSPRRAPVTGVPSCIFASESQMTKSLRASGPRASVQADQEAREEPDFKFSPVPRRPTRGAKLNVRAMVLVPARVDGRKCGIVFKSGKGEGARR
ncbi:hypothetical protein B0H17DRAFT_1337332 [Mycena rosella]|uniref:Uncharacterized protein n=1 Tax=Mycena rosella TaxID=1033263 RepID=A0AAD7G6H1_MYCRO|nr:hypothetical protein B0H17DRAFT_1337332 [Mycena rosella]